MTQTIIREADLIQSIADALQFISYYHPADYIETLAEAWRREEGPAARDAMAQILRNSRMAAGGRRPICQDTGTAQVFLRVGMDVRIETGRDLQAVVDEAVRRAWLAERNPLRASVVSDPLFARTNTGDNTPAMLTVELVAGGTVEVHVAAKGGGSENKARFASLNPSDDVAEWVLRTVEGLGAGWCPPGLLGIGVGGSPDKAMSLAKQALLDPIDLPAIRARGAATREEAFRLSLCDRVNALGIGAQGLGGLTTVLDVKLRTMPTHAASLPVALIPQCAADRHVHFTLDGSGPARLDPPGLDAFPAELGAGGPGERPSRGPRHPDARGGGDLARGGDGAALGADADRAGRGAPAHDADAGARRAAARRSARPRDLLRGAGGRGGGRGGGARGPDHLHAHGQVPRRAAARHRAAADDRQGGAGPGRGGEHRPPWLRLPRRGGGRRVPGVARDPLGAGARLRRPRHGGDPRVRGGGHARHRGGGHAGDSIHRTGPLRWRRAAA